MRQCPLHEEPNSIQPNLTEEMIINYDALPKGMKGWRRFRIEYGFECSCPEGLIYLPPNMTMEDVDTIEEILNKYADQEPFT